MSCKVLCVVLLLTVQASSRCPEQCRCPETEIDIILVIHCNNVSLLDVPSGDLEEVFFIDLSFNRITTLKNEAFMKRNLLKVGRLYLDGNQITTIEEHAFRGLTDLKILNLGSNNITNVSSDIFETNTELEVLSFRGNKNLQLPDAGFHLTNLDILSLNQCGLKDIPPKFFHSMPKLHFIFLRGNELSSFDPRLISPLAQLRQLDLRDNAFTSLQFELFHVLPLTLMINFQGNPLKCDCEMFDSYALYQVRTYYEFLHCDNPTRVVLQDFFLTTCNKSVTFPLIKSSSEPVTASDRTTEEVETTLATVEDDTTTTTPLTSTESSSTVPPPGWHPWWAILSVVLGVAMVIGITCVIVKRRRAARGYTVHRTFTVLDDDEEQNFIT